MENKCIEIIGCEIFKFNSKQELTDCSDETDARGLLFELEFDPDEITRWPIYCLWNSEGSVFKINKKLYDTLGKLEEYAE